MQNKKLHLSIVRNSIVVALHTLGYSYSDICEIMGIKNRDTVMRIVKNQNKGVSFIMEGIINNVVKMVKVYSE